MKIFVSYRRGDCQAAARLISFQLEKHFGEQSVMLDVDNIPIAVDFVDHIVAKIRQSDVLVALIGSGWLVDAKTGKRRLDDPNDYVRLEIETALIQRIPVIPILVDGTAMPEATELPTSLFELTRRNGLALHSGGDFATHVTNLVEGLKRAVLKPVSTRLSEDPWQTGDRVLAPWEARWSYPATIRAVDGTRVFLVYEDYDTGWVRKSQLRPMNIGVNDKIFANWMRQGGYYPGTVIQVEGEYPDIKFHVLYDDDMTEIVTLDQVRVENQSFPAARLRVNDRVLGNWKRLGNYYMGTVNHIEVEHPNTSYHIFYDDGDNEIATLDQLRVFDANQASNGSVIGPVRDDMRVMSRRGGKQFLPGVVKRMHGNEVDVLYSDGVLETAPLEHVRPLAASRTGVLRAPGERVFAVSKHDEHDVWVSGMVRSALGVFYQIEFNTGDAFWVPEEDVMDQDVQLEERVAWMGREGSVIRARVKKKDGQSVLVELPEGRFEWIPLDVIAVLR